MTISVVSVYNSTSIPLESGETFAGTGEDCLYYNVIGINIITSHVSATSGFQIQFSSNNSDWDIKHSFTVPAATGKFFNFPTEAQYFRIIYTNGTTPHTYFRLQTILHLEQTKESTLRLAEDIDSETAAQLSRSIISGKKPNGNYTNVRVDSDGRLQVSVTPITTNTTLQLAFDKSHTAVNTGQWQEVLSYTIPTGYDFSCISFDAISFSATESARVVYKLNLGSYACSTNTFTDDSSWTLPRFAARMYVYVTTQVGVGSDDTITIIYINQTGVTGRTTTVTIPKSSLVGTRVEVALQTGDFGVTDVTNVTHSATGQAGAFDIEGTLGIFRLTLALADVQYDSQTVQLGSIVIPQNDTIHLQYLSKGSTGNRKLNLIGILVPRGA
jgi:hypothetical protein